MLILSTGQDLELSRRQAARDTPEILPTVWQPPGNCVEVIWIRLIEVGRSTLIVSGRVPWADILVYRRGRKQVAHQHLVRHASWNTDTMLQAASTSCCQDIPPLSWTSPFSCEPFPLWAEANSSFLELFLFCVSVVAMRQATHAANLGQPCLSAFCDHLLTQFYLQL